MVRALEGSPRTGADPGILERGTFQTDNQEKTPVGGGARNLISSQICVGLHRVRKMIVVGH